MDRMGRLGGREERTGPSPIDTELLQITRELSAQFQVPYRYTRIAWARFVRGDGDWMRSNPVFLGGSLDVELLLPEYLKGKLPPDGWRTLIALHLVRLKAYNSRKRTSRFLGKIALAPRSLFFLLLIYIPVVLASPRSTASVVVLIFPSPIFLLAALWLRRSLRKSLKLREFELDKIAADQVGTLQVSQVLEKMETLKWKTMAELRSLYVRYYFLRSSFVSYWNPSVNERVGELTNPRVTGLPRPPIVPRIGLLGRVFIVLAGLSIFWGSGIVAGILYLHGESSITCMDNTCAALVVISVLGFWTAVISGISIAISVVRRFV